MYVILSYFSVLILSLSSNYGYSTDPSLHHWSLEFNTFYLKLIFIWVFSFLSTLDFYHGNFGQNTYFSTIGSNQLALLKLMEQLS